MSLLNEIIKSERTVLHKKDKYLTDLRDNGIKSLQYICILNLREKDKNFLYNNREVYPDLFEEMILPVKNAKLIVHLSITLRELFAWIDHYRNMGFGD